MTRIRPIRDDELDLFVGAAGDPRHHAEIKQYVEKMFAARSMRPDWCFVIEESYLAVGRAALWTLPGMDEPFALVLLDVPWEGEYRSVGENLLRHALDGALELGAREIGHVLDAPPMGPQWQHHAEKRVGLLESAGFAMKRETIRFEWRGNDGAPEVPGRLVFRPLDEVGENAFVDAMIRVSEGTLDREIQDERDELGPEKAGREFFEMEGNMEHEPSWWHLAYTPGGELVGLIMASKNPTSPVIGYIGVVPEHRGRGYVDDLLAMGTRTLLDTGAEFIRADTDVNNTPMADAFRRAGYAEFAGRREYGVKLDR